jgi:hypothetical protein
MKFASLLILLTLLFSCSDNSSHSLSASDSLVIQIKSVESGNSFKKVSTTNKNAIKKLAQFVEESKSEEHECGTEGSLLFYSKETVVKEILFAYSKEGCQHFSWKEGEVMHDVKMSNEASDFLKGLAEGNSWY